MNAVKVNQECVVRRRDLFQTLLRIFGEELGEANLNDLPQMKRFSEHAAHCNGCAALGTELAKAFRVRFDRRPIRE